MQIFLTALAALTLSQQILQTRDAVVIWTEYGPDVRIIPFAEKHGTKVFPSALGDSIARWEGETLVIETVNLPGKDAVRPRPYQAKRRGLR